MTWRDDPTADDSHREREAEEFEAMERIEAHDREPVQDDYYCECGMDLVMDCRCRARPASATASVPTTEKP